MDKMLRSWVPRVASHGRTTSSTRVQKQFQEIEANQDVNVPSGSFHKIQQGVGDNLWFHVKLFTVPAVALKGRVDGTDCLCLDLPQDLCSKMAIHHPSGLRIHRAVRVQS